MAIRPTGQNGIEWPPTLWHGRGMPEKKATKVQGDAIRACIKKEMTQPRVAMSARKKYAELPLKIRKVPLSLG